MSTKLCAFRDLATGTVRVTIDDPSAVLEGLGLRKSTASIPGGFSMRELRRYFETTEQSLNGTLGGEGFVELEIGTLSSDDLTALMTPPPDGDGTGGQ